MENNHASHIRLAAITCVVAVFAAASVAGAIGRLVAVAFSDQLISIPVRYRVTAELTIGDATGVGTSVWETVLGYRSGSSLQVSPKYTLGEAINIVLPGQQEYFLLRRSKDISPSPFFGLLTMDCIQQTGSLTTDHSQAMRAIEEWNGPCRVTTEPPELIRFRDSNNPETIERVPYKFNSDCAEICLKIYVDRTSDNLSRDVLRLLPWINNISVDQDISGNRYSLRYVNASGPRAFSKIDFTTTESN